MKNLTLAGFAVCGLALLSIQALARDESGVSGGGGNVMYPVDPKDPASVAEVHSAVGRAKEQVAEYLHEKQKLFAKGALSPDDESSLGALFRSHRRVGKLTEKTKMEIESDRPCFDAQRNPVDGSTYTGHEDAICVSSLAISQKVERADVPAQSAALIAHEITEIVGLREEEAVRVQAKVLDDFRRAPSEGEHH